MDLQHAHVAVGCNNSPTVVWTSHLISSQDTIAANLLHALSLCMLACRASPWPHSTYLAAPTIWLILPPTHSIPSQMTVPSSPTSLLFFLHHRTFVASLSPTQQHHWQSLLCHENHHVASGMVAANNQQRNHYWSKGLQFLPTNIDPYFQGVPCKDQISILQAFVKWA